MECRLQTAGTWSCQVSLRFGQNSESPGQREIPFGPPISDKSLIADVLRRAQRAVLLPHVPTAHFLSSSGVNTDSYVAPDFTDNCVCVHVRGPDVPDLYFYDLPGKRNLSATFLSAQLRVNAPGIIADVAHDNGAQAVNLVRNLVEDYVSRPNCIILLVVSCESKHPSPT